MENDKISMFYGASPILFRLAKTMRMNPTEAEEYLWNHLGTERFKGFRFRRQHPILFFIADFYCHTYKLVIEVDGGYHTLKEQYEYDQEREQELRELGITVLRFTNKKVLNNISHVLQTIEQTLKEKRDANQSPL
ncbi:MAG: endonuclease domain-containing protein [Tannerellaceae bacterium]|nr:endonuclease domain-containing protein [Tannerellaceae bacterium]